MAINTPLEWIELYQTAIQSVLNGQEYRIGDISYKRADLEKLNNGLQYWQKQYRMQTSGGRSRRANFSNGI